MPAIDKDGIKDTPTADPSIGKRNYAAAFVGLKPKLFLLD